MRLIGVILAVVAVTEVSAQLGGLFDYGGVGLDFFMPQAGYNEGPCIERTRRRRRRRKSTVAPSVVVTPNTVQNAQNQANKASPANSPVTNLNNPQILNPAATGNANFNNNPQLSNSAFPDQLQPAPLDPFFGSFDYMFNLYDPVPPPPPPPPVVNAHKSANTKGIVIDYSKLTNAELQSLIKIAARQAAASRATGKASQSHSNTFREAIKKDPAKTPTYNDLIRQLEDLSTLANVQKGKVLSSANNNFRKLDKQPRRRSIRSRAKRQFPLDLLGMMGGGGTVPISMCSCISKSDVDSDHFVQPRSKYKCKSGRGLVCACNMGGFNR